MSTTRDEVAAAFRNWAAATGALDLETVREFERGAVGFGYRSAAIRRMAAVSDEDYIRATRAYFKDFESYRLDIESLDTEAKGDLGLAWGWYVEEFKRAGEAPQRVRVRFSQTMKKESPGWRVVMFHRDRQEFAGG